MWIYLPPQARQVNRVSGGSLNFIPRSATYSSCYQQRRFKLIQTAVNLGFGLFARSVVTLVISSSFVVEVFVCYVYAFISLIKAVPLFSGGTSIFILFAVNGL